MTKTPALPSPKKPANKATGAQAKVDAKPLAAGRNENVVATLGERIKTLRTEAGMTLDQLAIKSGVSRAMLSKVERREKSPTLSIISRIGRGLNMTLSALLRVMPDTATIAVTPKAKRVIFIDPETGFERHLLSPTHVDNGVELLMHRIPAGSSSGELPPYTSPAEKYLVVQEGSLTVLIGHARYVLHSGDAMYFEVKEPYSFINEGNKPCSYYLTIVRRR
ncbi:MAG: XRE family transcriptional regulator [Pseudomonadota bacterium]|nr:XRE family transcriptional regulator [Pseudomonadota bacterium]